MNYEELLKIRGKELRDDHLCRRRFLRHQKLSAKGSVQAASSVVLGEINPVSSPTISLGTRALSSEPRSNSSTSPTSSQMGTGSTSDSGSLSTLRGVEIRDDSFSNRRLWVLFGVQKNRPTLKLAQLNTENYKDDDAFFQALKKKYRKRRGFWKTWFSIWRLSYCDFVKVIAPSHRSSIN